MNANAQATAPDDSELSTLIEILHRTSRRLEELTGGEVDSVADRHGRTFLLGHAQERLRDDVALKQAAILDALPANIALLDTGGRIVSVNEAWKRFARVNSMAGSLCAMGVNYLEVCDAAEGEGVAGARDAAEGIRSVLASAADSFAVEYPCHSPSEQRWFRMTVTPLANDRSLGVVVMHIDVSAEKRSEAELRNAERETQRQMIEASRRSGMADVATTVLHNVGNVLNSVNVSADLIMEALGSSRVSRIKDVVALLREHEADLAGFITRDSRGSHILSFMDDLSREWAAEQQAWLLELESLKSNIDHIKQIVAVQQDHAIARVQTEVTAIAGLIDEALGTQRGSMIQSGVRVIRELDDLPPVNVAKHKVLQIVINLLRNATLACEESGNPGKCVWIRATRAGDWIRITVRDNGTGIAPENMARIFSHGFTTRKDGHGFGLHGGALAAADLGGTLKAESGGPGRGATFTLEFPAHTGVIHG